MSAEMRERPWPCRAVYAPAGPLLVGSGYRMVGRRRA